MVKINMISVKKLIEYISMESIIKKRIVIRLDENKSLTEIPEGIVEQKCFYKINYYLFLFIALSSKRKNKIIIDIKQISNFICITWYYEYHNNKILLSLFLKILNRNFKRNDKYIAYLDNKFLCGYADLIFNFIKINEEIKHCINY